jgi:hypothetical protein
VIKCTTAFLPLLLAACAAGPGRADASRAAPAVPHPRAVGAVPSCLAQPTAHTVRAPAGTGPYATSPKGPMTLDMTALDVAIMPPQADGITVNNAPGGTCISGGSVTGQQSRDLGWEVIHHPPYNADGVHWSHPTTGQVTVENTHIVNVEDAIGPPKGLDVNSAATFLVRGVHAEYVRDDFLENDGCMSGEVSDVLVDNSHMFLSERNSNGPCWNKQKDLYVRDSVVWLGCQPDPRTNKNITSCPRSASGISQSAGQVFKWAPGSGTVRMENVVVRLDATPASGVADMDFPAGAYSNVTIVWTHAGPYPRPVPPGVAVTTDVTVWQTARQAWLDAHPGM